ncbi:MAG TPA: spore photoproduct lyase, partial [Syntrophomonadaceae bacterium]|nr:spore photoproduct lyase [Syntrophomonadaceae bacterium]
MGKRAYDLIKSEGHKVVFLMSHNRVTGIPGSTPREAFFQGKTTIVVGVRRTLDFAGCKPSAHYQLPLVTGCPGICEYCYLNTQLGKKPYMRLYVNVEEILSQAAKYIEARKPETTVFEAAATSDPLPGERYTGALARAIEFFAGQEYGRLRFVTKFTLIDSLLEVKHNMHTRIRYSLNTPKVIHQFEHRTPPSEARLEALGRIIEHGYPAGIIIAPVILDSGWEDQYGDLLHRIKDSLSGKFGDITFEIISHRFTSRARTNITAVFPETALPMDESSDRRYKYGQFGYGKYVYSEDKLKYMKE